MVDFGQDYVGDFLTYAFPRKYDVIVAHHVVEHIADTAAFFNKSSEVLNPGGMIDIRVPTLPYFAFVDPTHVKFIPDETFFRYFTKSSPAGYCYSDEEFEMTQVDRDRYDWELHVVMRKP